MSIPIPFQVRPVFETGLAPSQFTFQLRKAEVSILSAFRHPTRFQRVLGPTEFTFQVVGVGRIELPVSCTQNRRPTIGLHPDSSDDKDCRD